MNLRNTWLLLGAVVIVIIVFVLVLTLGPRGEDEFVFHELRGRAKGEEVDKIRKGISRVEIERMRPTADPIVFEREGEKWKLKSPFEARVDSETIDRLIAALFDAKLDHKTPIPPRAQLGLDSPSAAVSLTREGKSHRVILGDMSIGSPGRVFAATGENPKKSLAFRRTAIEDMLRRDAAGTGPVGEALKNVAAFLPQNLLLDGSTLPWKVTQKIALKAGAKEVVIQKAGESAWQFLKPADYGFADPEGDPTGPAAQNIAGVNPLLTRLAGIRMPPPEDVIAGVSNFTEYGLDSGKETMRIDIGRTEGANDVLLIGAKADPRGEKVFARMENERVVVKLDAKSLEPIRNVIENPSSLRDRVLIPALEHAFDAVDITLPGDKPFELRFCGEPRQWRLFEGTDAYDSANRQAVEAIFNELMNPRRNIREFPDPSKGDKEYGFDAPAAHIDFWVNAVPAPENAEAAKKRPVLKGPPVMRLTFGKRNNDIVYVKRQTGPVSHVVAIPEKFLATMTRPLSAYLDLTLPSFKSDQATKLSFNRGTVKFELEKPTGDAAAKWKATQPPDLAPRALDQNALGRMFANLETLNATRVIARKPTEAELTRWGLKPPRIEAAVLVKDAKDPLKYEFGVEADDKQHYYARVGASTWVYLVDKAKVDTLETTELPDPTIWQLESDDALKNIKITGKERFTGKMGTLSLDRKGAGQWIVTDQPNSPIDPAKVDAFAKQLKLVRTDKVVKAQGGPEPDHKLGPQDDIFVLELKVADQNEPFTLTLGAETKIGNTPYYFATSNRLPGAVFLVFKDRFEGLRKDGFAFFEKPK